MKQFNFNGDWEVEINLQEFINSNLKWSENISSSKLKTSIKLKILDLKNLEPDPTKEQIATINYIIDNEISVLKSVCKAFQTINKTYGDNCGEHDWYSKEMNFYELGNVFLINEIEIFTEHKNGQAYFQLNGEYKGDYEHGLIVVMHLDKLIDYNQIGEDGYNGVYNDLGEQATSFREFNIRQREFGENKVHTPIPKYEKFKPWQLNSTSEYFENLLREKKNKKIIDEIENNQWDINLRFPSLDKNLVDISAYLNNIEVLGILIEKGGDYSKSILQCINYGFYRPESIKLLVSKGASIDTYGYWNKTPLCNELENFIRVIVRKEEYKNEDQKRYDKAIEEYKLHKKKIQFYLELGANPNHLDKDKKTYEDIVKNSWAEHVLEKYNIIGQVENLLFPNQSKISKWQFWKN